MGAKSANSIRFASNGDIYVAPVGTAAPTDVSSSLATTWRPLGYVNSNGVVLTPSVTTQAIEAWQSATPIRYLVTAASFQVQFTLHQWDKEAVELYFGASFSEAQDSEGNPISGVYKLNLESTPDLVETALIVEWTDSTVKSRLVIPRAQVSAREGLTLVRTTNQQLGVTLDALDLNGSLGFILTDADMAAA